MEHLPTREKDLSKRGAGMSGEGRPSRKMRVEATAGCTHNPEDATSGDSSVCLGFERTQIGVSSKSFVCSTIKVDLVIFR